METVYGAYQSIYGGSKMPWYAVVIAVLALLIGWLLDKPTGKEVKQESENGKSSDKLLDDLDESAGRTKGLSNTHTSGTLRFKEGVLSEADSNLSEIKFRDNIIYSYPDERTIGFWELKNVESDTNQSCYRVMTQDMMEIGEIRVCTFKGKRHVFIAFSRDGIHKRWAAQQVTIKKPEPVEQTLCVLTDGSICGYENDGNGANKKTVYATVCGDWIGGAAAFVAVAVLHNTTRFHDFLYDWLKSSLNNQETGDKDSFNDSNREKTERTSKDQGRHEPKLMEPVDGRESQPINHIPALVSTLEQQNETVLGLR